MDEYTRLIDKIHDETDKVVELIIAGQIKTVEECEKILREVNWKLYEALEEEHVRLAREKDPKYRLAEVGDGGYIPAKAESFLEYNTRECRDILAYLNGDQENLEDHMKWYIEGKLGEHKEAELDRAYKEVIKRRGKIDYSKFDHQRHNGLNNVVELIITGEISTIEQCEERLREVNWETYKALEDMWVVIAKEDPAGWQSCMIQGREYEYGLPKANVLLEGDLIICKEVLTYLDGDFESLNISERGSVEFKLKEFIKKERDKLK